MGPFSECSERNADPLERLRIPAQENVPFTPYLTSFLHLQMDMLLQIEQTIPVYPFNAQCLIYNKALRYSPCDLSGTLIQGNWFELKL